MSAYEPKHHSVPRQQMVWLYWLQDRDSTLSTILQHCTHTMKPSDPLLLADGNLRCGIKKQAIHDIPGLDLLCMQTSVSRTLFAFCFTLWRVSCLVGQNYISWYVVLIPLYFLICNIVLGQQQKLDCNLFFNWKLLHLSTLKPCLKKGDAKIGKSIPLTFYSLCLQAF
jgi:hypothetical protein